MCTQVLVVLGGDLDEELVPLYRRAEEEGALSIVGYARPTERGLSFEGMDGEVSVQRVLLSCSKLFGMISSSRDIVRRFRARHCWTGAFFEYKDSM